MKKNVIYFLMLMCSLSIFISCKDDDDHDVPEPDKALPIVEWPSNATFDTLEIMPDMKGKALIVVKAEAGIKDFKLNITSEVLTQETLGEIGLATDMDLINDGNVAEILGSFQIPVGSKLKDATNVNFDISSLVPMILVLNPEHSGYHVFTLNITDNSSNKITKAIVFHNTVPGVLKVSDIDLWANTAVVTPKNIPDGAKVQYRIKGETEWLDTKKLEEGKFLIEAAWTEETNEKGLTIYNVNAKTGVFAGHTYELRVMDGEEEFCSESFVTAYGDVIENADMSKWSEKTMPGLVSGSVQVSYPNEVSENGFWECGNNAATKALCIRDSIEHNPYAKLKATKMIVLAAGNLFTGKFEYANFGGTASFGQSYVYSARPTALKLRYKAIIGNVDLNKHQGPIAIGEPDKGRIFVSIVNWNERHAVVSNTKSASGMWDPETMIGLNDTETVIAYGSKYITESTTGEDMIELTIPIHYYDKEAVAPAGNYTLVISCSTSAYGDYMNGCSTNELHVDDFQWIYE